MKNSLYSFCWIDFFFLIFVLYMALQGGELITNENVNKSKEKDKGRKRKQANKHNREQINVVICKKIENLNKETHAKMKKLRMQK